jgi:hypothetical protein
MAVQIEIGLAAGFLLLGPSTTLQRPIRTAVVCVGSNL